MKGVLLYMLLLLIASLGNIRSIYGQGNTDSDFSGLYCDALYVEGNLVFQDIYFVSAEAVKVNVTVLFTGWKQAATAPLPIP